MGEGSLRQVFGRVAEHLRKSLYEDDDADLCYGPWQSTLKVVGAGSANLGEEVLGARGGHESLDIVDDWGHNKRLFVSRQGSACIFGLMNGRRAANRFFWRFVAISEFVALKKRIYVDYANMLGQKVSELKEYRLSFREKATREDVRRLSVYDRDLIPFLKATDRLIRPLRPFYRRVYSLISAGTGFDAIRKRVIGLVEKWEKEVEEWRHPLVSLWKKVISPLKSVLSKQLGASIF